MAAATHECSRSHRTCSHGFSQVHEWRLEYNDRRPHSGINWQTPTAFAANLNETITEAFPAAMLAGPPVRAPPVPQAQPASQPHPILS